MGQGAGLLCTSFARTSLMLTSTLTREDDMLATGQNGRLRDNQAVADSYWPAEASSPVLDTTVGGVLRAAAADAPDRLAMVAGMPDPADRRRWTFGELLRDAEQAARALAERFATGERVAVWAPGLPEWVVLEFAAAMAGLVLVTVNPAYRPNELEYVLRQSGASGIFHVSAFRSDMAAYLEEVRPNLPDLREVVRFEDWNAFVASGSPAQSLPTVSPDDIAQIQYTSGTTGFPKGAMLHHRGLTNNARLYAECIQLAPGEVYINPMPLFHTAGCAMGVLGAAQSRAAHVPTLAFDPAVILDLVEAERADVILAVPTMLIALLDHPDASRRDLSSLRSVVSGGAPVPADLVRRTERELDVRFTIVFGTTECSPLVTATSHDDTFDDRSTTLGRAFPQTELRVSDAVTGGVLPLGEVGELCARGYMVMTGYHNAPDATAAAIDDDGWYHTGDLASMDARGYVRIEGRIKDMIIRGGENIYPREIESVLFSHPDVADVAVIGVPDEQWGEIVVAVIRPAPEATPDVDALRALCRQHLAAFKTPAQWHFVDAFPTTPSGKVQKYKLRDMVVTSIGAVSTRP
jgi:fatty-acyl-CoA synthase